MTHKGHYTLKFADGRSESLTLAGKALNRGADGAIYRSPDKRYALKYYHEPGKDPARQNKVWQMVLHPPEDSSAGHFAWPLALILNAQGTFVGFAMPLLDIARYVSLDLVLSARGRQMESLPQSGAWRLKVAQNLACRVAELHAKGHCIIDLKPANLLVHRHSGDVAVVDCDGFAVQGNTEYFPAHQFTAGFIAPEAFSARQPPQELRQPQDAFALAVILFKLLNGGLHPYQGVPHGRRDIPSDNQNRIAGGYYPYAVQAHPDIKPSPWSIHRDFPRILRETFDRSFKQRQRPGGQEWLTLLGQAEPRLKTCANDRDHSYWGNKCPHCVRATTRVKVAKARPQAPARQPAHAPRYQPPIAAPAPAPPAATPVRPAASGGLWLILLVALVVLLVMMLTQSLPGNSKPSAEPSVSPAEFLNTPPPPLLPRAWHQRGPALEPRYTQDRSVTYRTRSSQNPTSRSHDEIGKIIPFSRFGAFDQPEVLTLLSSVPLGPEVLGAALKPYLTRLDMVHGGLSTIATYDKHLGAYAMDFWQSDPRPGRTGIYLPWCTLRSCDLLHRLEPGRSELTYKLPEWQANPNLADDTPWHYSVSPEGGFLAMANARQIAVFAVDRPQKPLAVLDFPEQFGSYTLNSLSLSDKAKSLFLGLSRESQYGVDFTAELLELTRDGATLTLRDDFAQRAKQSGSELLGSSQTLSRDGQTLAVSEYQLIEHNFSDYEVLMRPVTVAVGYPAISVWRRDAQGEWNLLQRIEWKGLRDSQKRPVLKPRGISLGSSLTFGGTDMRRVDREGEPNHQLQLSPDGSRLLTGLEIEKNRDGLTAHSYLFDTRSERTLMLARMSSRNNLAQSFDSIVSPAARLSDSGKHVAMGWFIHYALDRGLTLKQSARIEVFEAPESAAPDASIAGNQPQTSSQ